MTVETGSQPLLIEEMGNETDAATKHEETVENTHAEVILSLLGVEGTAISEQIHEADGNATIHVQNQVVLLRRRDCLHGEGVIKKLARREVLLNILLDKLDAQIRVVARLDTMTNARNYNTG